MVVAARVDRGRGLCARPSRRQLAAHRLLSAHILAAPSPTFFPAIACSHAAFRQIVSNSLRPFEIETELTVHALELELPSGKWRRRIIRGRAAQRSKLNTWHDGFRILWTVLKLYRAERPLARVGSASRSAWPSVSPSRSSSPMCRRVWCRACRVLDRFDGAGLPVRRRRADPRYWRKAKLIAYLALRAPGEDRRQTGANCPTTIRF